MLEDDKTSQTIASFEGPFGQKIELREVVFEKGVTLLRLYIREGNRFTVLDLDPDLAGRWGQALVTWAAEKNGSETSR
ncbi:MAG: hypothetical protein CFH06_00373 [Alphaproteobacteria bacterium MarineAlpha3_Bin5]|nr:MAG: hypothetical protein CFH06_00373 [Alphaproteobacteria bacterium MarineAlpha3_Bin5]